MTPVPPSDTPSPPSTPPAREQGLAAQLRRLLPRLCQDMQGGGGVTISGNANVNVTGDFIGGDKIINIGSIVVPVRFLFALLLVAAVVAVGVWWVVTPGKMPAGNANVAIVDFGVQDGKGGVANSAQGAYLSQWLYNRLGDSLADLPAEGRPTFWHLATGLDLTHLFQKRTLSAPIRNDAEAEKVARDFNARIVIYGNLAANQDPTNFTPQFYVAQSKGEADELGGSQQLGQPIPISKDINDERLELTLQPIGRALVWFSRGLNFDLNGEYDRAYMVLKEGEGKLKDWDEDQGKEVLYYFLGREALFLASCEDDAQQVFPAQGNRSAVDGALDTAEENFAHAQKIALDNGRTYARATYGLGQVVYQRAQRKLIPSGSSTVGQCKLNPPPVGTKLACPARAVAPTSPEALVEARTLVEAAIKLFDQAIDELDDLPPPPPPRLETKFHGARSRADTFLAQVLLLQNKPAEAQPLLTKAAPELEQLTKTADTEDRRTLGALFFAVGRTHLVQAGVRFAANDKAGGVNDLSNAVNAYQACVKLIPADDPDAFLRTNLLPNCSCTLSETQKTLDSLK